MAWGSSKNNDFHSATFWWLIIISRSSFMNNSSYALSSIHEFMKGFRKYISTSRFFYQKTSMYLIFSSKFLRKSTKNVSSATWGHCETRFSSVSKRNLSTILQNILLLTVNRTKHLGFRVHCTLVLKKLQQKMAFIQSVQFDSC